MNSRRTPRGEAGEAGFTLIEILVAFTVAALLLGGLYEVFAGGVRVANATRRTSEALLLAQSALEAMAGAPASAGQTNEQIGQFQRVTDITPRPDLLPPTAQADVVPYEVVVRVVWREGVRPRGVTLSTMWLAPKSAFPG